MIYFAILWLIPLFIALTLILMLRKIIKNYKNILEKKDISKLIFWALPFLYISFAMFIAGVLTIVTMLLLPLLRLQFFIYLYTVIFLLATLVSEYFGEYCVYKLMKKETKLNENIFDYFIWWIKYFIYEDLLKISQIISCRIILYIIAVVLVVFSSFAKIENYKGDYGIVDIIDRIVVTFIALERMLKNIYERWFNRQSDIKKLKDEQTKCSEEVVKTLVENMRKSKK